MNCKLLLSVVVPACIALQLAVLPIPASGQESFGGVGGVTRNSVSKQPVAQVQITAHHYCPVKSRTESIGCWDRVSQCRSRVREVPVKWAFSRRA
jgi:hypothetical protein